LAFIFTGWVLKSRIASLKTAFSLDQRGRFCGHHMRQDKTNTEFGGQQIFPVAANGVQWRQTRAGVPKSSSLRLKKKKKGESTFIGFNPGIGRFIPPRKNGFFFLRFFPSLGCFARFFFIAFLGRFVRRGVQKRDKNREKHAAAAKKSTYLLTSLFFSRRPLGHRPWLQGTRGAYFF
jgi:hypothetical protein